MDGGDKSSSRESRYASPKIPMQNSQCLEHKLLEERRHIHSGAMACAPVVDILDNCKGLCVADILRNLGIWWHQVILSNVMLFINLELFIGKELSSQISLRRSQVILRALAFSGWKSFFGFLTFFECFCLRVFLENSSSSRFSSRVFILLCSCMARVVT